MLNSASPFFFSLSPSLPPSHSGGDLRFLDDTSYIHFLRQPLSSYRQTVHSPLRLLSVCNCLFTGKMPLPCSRTPPCLSNLTLMPKVEKYTNCWWLFGQTASGGRQFSFGFKNTYFIKGDDLCGNSPRTLYDKCPSTCLLEALLMIVAQAKKTVPLDGLVPIWKRRVHAALSQA